jgi:hypothetical protein
VSGRREQLARVVRRKLRQQRAPVIFVLPTYATPPEGEPIVCWLLSHRPPTEAEIQDAIKKQRAEEAAGAPPSGSRSNPEPLGRDASARQQTLDARTAVRAARASRTR